MGDEEIGVFRLSKSKTEYLKYGFSGEEIGGEEVIMGDITIPRVEKFKYLFSIIEEKVDIGIDID